MKALVTGITGFAGGHLAAHLLAEGDQVLGTSRRAGTCTLEPWHVMPPGEFAHEMAMLGGKQQASAIEALRAAQAVAQVNDAEPELGELARLAANLTERLQAINLAGALRGPAGPSIPLVAWNVTEPAPPATFDQIAAFGPDVIYHLAAESIPNRCGDDVPTAAAWSANVGSVSSVLALAESLPRRPRVLVVSSSHVYVPLDRAIPPVNEDFEVGPVKGYGLTKLAAEREAQRASAGGLEVVIARPFNHTGPGQWPPLMLPEWCEQLANARFSTLDGWVDLSDVRDVVRAYRMMAALGTSAGIYNVGLGKSLRTGDILQELLTVHGTPRKVVETHPHTVYGPVADTARLFQAGGWQPRIPLRDTLADTLAWWRTGPRRPGSSASSESKD
jgi:GDP-4-dehydro-6-deoxy-D-mannose reductase